MTLPIHVRPAHLETDASFSARLLAANHISAKGASRVTKTLRLIGADPARRRAELERLGGVTLGRGERFAGQTLRHAGGGSCARCFLGVDDRYACVDCARGSTIRQVAHDADFVCVRHHRWIGQGASPERQTRVSAPIVAAQLKWRRMRRRGQISQPVTAELLDLLQRWNGLVADHRSDAELFHIAVTIWATLVNEGRLAVITDPTVSNAKRYKELDDFVRSAGVSESAPVTDGVWLLLRPTALYRADLLGVRAPLAIADQHMPAVSAPARGEPAEPFEQYNAQLRTCAAAPLEDFELRTLAPTAEPLLRRIADRRPPRPHWICNHGHRLARTAAQIRSNYQEAYAGCGACSRKQAYPGSNTLADLSPDVAARWDAERNGERTPESVTGVSGVLAHWRCPEGHSYTATVQAAVRRYPGGCPICSGRRAAPGETSLDVLRPELMAFWDYDKNTADPSTITRASGQKCWWKCDRGHSFDFPVHKMTVGLCPVCSGKRVIAGENDLATANPDVASEWHPTKNAGSLPSQITPNTHTQYWWQCQHGHEWLTSVHNRTSGYGCPWCAHRYIQEGINSLADLEPEVAREWHPFVNGDLRPGDVATTVWKKVWWLCPLGHTFRQAVAQHVQRGTCLICSNRQTLPGFNDVLTRFPQIAADWDDAANPPAILTRTGNTKRAWVCPAGHRLTETVLNRARTEGCPRCPRERRAMHRGTPADLSTRASRDLLAQLFHAEDPDARLGNADESNAAHPTDNTSSAASFAMAKFRQRLHEAIAGRSVESIAAMANIGAREFRRVLDGRVAFNLVVVGRLQIVLSEDLWQDLES